MIQRDKIVLDRLQLRKPNVSDADAIFKNWATDEEVAKYSTWRTHKSIEDTNIFIQYMLDCWHKGNELTWLISLLNSEEAIGAISVRPKKHVIELGYALGRVYWNQGYMTEAVSGIMEMLFCEPGIYRVWAFCDVQNVASIKVLEKSGMQKEGLLRKWSLHPNVSDIPRDCYCYSEVKIT